MWSYSRQSPSLFQDHFPGYSFCAGLTSKPRSAYIYFFFVSSIEQQIESITWSCHLDSCHNHAVVSMLLHPPLVAVKSKFWRYLPAAPGKAQWNVSYFTLMWTFHSTFFFKSQPPIIKKKRFLIFWILLLKKVVYKSQLPFQIIPFLPFFRDALHTREKLQEQIGRIM